MSVGAFSAMCFSVYMEDVLTTPARFTLALIIGGIAAGIAGVLIGIPVLRLQGDYLAIVTLAFGEIIKNVLNATYLGIDGSGIHVSLKDAASMNLRPTQSDYQRPAGNYQYPQRRHFYRGHPFDSVHAVHCAEPD